jgi:Spy/CpxP family protein refolding chaperone
MKATKLLFLAVVLLLVPITAPASEQSPYKWWQAEKSRSDLGLSADQSVRIEEVFQSNVPKLKAAGDDLERLERQLSNLISGEVTTEADVIRQLDLIEAARAELNKTRILMLFRMRRILTPEQREKLKALHEQAERQSRHQSS